MKVDTMFMFHAVIERMVNMKLCISVTVIWYIDITWSKLTIYREEMKKKIAHYIISGVRHIFLEMFWSSKKYISYNPELKFHAEKNAAEMGDIFN